MPVTEQLFSLFALCLSVLSAGLFLRGEKRTTLLSALWALVICGAALLCLPSGAAALAGPWGGLLSAGAWLVRREKRSAVDGVLMIAVGGCYVRLWTIFCTGMEAVCQVDIVFWLYCVFFLLHLPAVLLTFPSLSLPTDWQVQLRENRRRLRPWHLPALGCVLLLLLWAAFPFFRVEDGFSAAAKILLAAALFWAGLLLIALLAAYSRQYQRSTAESGYRSDMTTFLNVVRSQRHDYNLHVQTVASLIAQQKWEECRSYVDALVRDTAELNAILPVKDPAVAALIGNYRALAAQQGIRFLADVRDDMTQIATDTYETNKIIGNLLQNALDELERQPERADRQICLDIFKRGEYCLIRVSNKVGDKAAFALGTESIFRQGYTTKEGHDGVGLSSIRALARRAGGEVSVWLEDDTAHFIASIPINSAARESGR